MIVYKEIFDEEFEKEKMIYKNVQLSEKLFKISISKAFR